MKRNINIDRKTLASEEINATKDFSSVVSKAGGGSSVSPKVPQSNTGWIIGGIATVAIATGIYFGTNSPLPTTDNVAVSTIEHIDSTKSVFVNPPLPEATIPNESYTINADKGGEIKHHTGTDITIPEGAFTDEEGNIVTGDVEVQYREFHDQADIFLSGIPMDYDTLGEKHIFESAGMLEIRGFQNGKRLKITPNKNFKICMKTNNPDPKFNLYYLDEKAKKWNYEGKDSISIPNEYPIADNTNDFSNSGLEVKWEDEQTKEEITETKEEIVIIKKEIKTIKKTKPTKPKKANKDKKNFTIDVVKSEYPELAVYTGTIFEVKKNEDLPEDTYSVTWNDVKLKEENNSYLIQLSKGERTEEIAVIPVLEGLDYKNAKIVFDSKFGEYNTKLDKKLKKEKFLEETLTKLKNKFKKEREESERKFKEQMAKLETKKRNVLTMQRVFNVTRFGTWNCDSPSTTPVGRTVFASYVDNETGEELTFSRLELVVKERNICFPIDYVRQQNLPFSPKSHNSLWGVTRDGMVAIANNQEFKNTENKTPYTFKMKVFDIKGKSISEIKSILKN